VKTVLSSFKHVMIQSTSSLLTVILTSGNTASQNLGILFICVQVYVTWRKHILLVHCQIKWATCVPLRGRVVTRGMLSVWLSLLHQFYDCNTNCRKSIKRNSHIPFCCYCTFV